MWQPIETAPKDGTDVLLYKRFSKYQKWVGKDEYDFYIQIGCYSSGDWRIHAYDPPWNNDPTHWMPLPEPPALEGKDGQAV
jgi:hypothetical protein